MKLFKYISIFLTISLSILYFFNCPWSYQNYSGKIYGTYYHIKVKSPIKNKNLGKKIKYLLKLTNYSMSVFEKDSEINKINNLKAKEPLTLSPEMAKVLATSYEIYDLSNGNFDPTVAPLIDLWGFGTQKEVKFPSEKEISEKLKHVGFKKLSFSQNFQEVEKTDNEIHLNLSAIAKGYAVDSIAEMLTKDGYKNYIVEIGGEIRTSGSRNTGKDGWDIGIRNPHNDDNAFVLTLKNKAIATSGDYRNFFVKDGIRYSHTISPRNGFPVQHNLASVTVIDDSCMKADAFATAIMSMGFEKGLEFSNKNKIPAIFFVRTEENQDTTEDEEENFTTHFSKAAAKLSGE